MFSIMEERVTVPRVALGVRLRVQNVARRCAERRKRKAKAEQSRQADGIDSSCTCYATVVNQVMS